MSRGMWTMHLSARGVVYYYNAALNQSVWSPPSDAVVQTASHPLMTVEDYRLYLEEHSSVHSVISAATNVNDKQQAYTSIPQQQLQQAGAEIFLSSQLEDELARRQREAAIAKRLKAATSQPNTGSGLSSSYLRQKSELEAVTACKSDDTAKWLVR